MERACDEPSIKGRPVTGTDARKGVQIDGTP